MFYFTWKKKAIEIFFKLLKKLVKSSHEMNENFMAFPSWFIAYWFAGMFELAKQNIILY